MAILTNIRQALKVQLATIAGLNTFAQIPDSFVVPAALVGIVPSGTPIVEYDANFAGAKIGKPGATWHLLIRVYLGKVMTIDAQKSLDDFIDPTGSKSVKYAIESNRTLSGACDDLRVTQAQGYAQYDIGGVKYLGIEFAVDVYT